MPFKSLAQQRKLEELVAQGKLSQAVLDGFKKDSIGVTLPERVQPKPQGKIGKVKSVRVLGSGRGR